MLDDHDIQRIADAVVAKLLPKLRLPQQVRSPQRQQTVGADVDLTDAYTPREVSQMLGVKIGTLATWRQNLVANRPPFVRVSPRCVLYPRQQFDAWARRQKLINPDDV